MEYQLESSARGTRLLAGNLATERRTYLSQAASLLESYGFEEILLPSLEQASLYTTKAGDEVRNQMYVFPDRKGRELCLRPEGTATIQALARKHFRTQKDVKLWYECRCWRYERPQSGRYREFTQLGVEWLNPDRDVQESLIALAKQLLELRVKEHQYEVATQAMRGLAYYLNGQGFEISCPELGAQQQVVGGGAYAEGTGFAIGLDRLLLLQPTPSSP